MKWSIPAPVGVTRFAALVMSLVLAYAAGALGSLFTSATSAWYTGLVKPALNPPAWVFAPVWTVLYALMAIAAWRVFERRAVPGATGALWLYAAQLVLNAFWSVAFFGLHSPRLALAVIILLFALIILTALRFWRIDRAAGFLFVPYAAWVAFAGYLNLLIVLLNP